MCKNASSFLKCVVAVSGATATAFAIAGQVQEDKVSEYVAGLTTLALTTVAASFEYIRRAVNQRVQSLVCRSTSSQVGPDPEILELRRLLRTINISEEESVSSIWTPAGNLHAEHEEDGTQDQAEDQAEDQGEKH